MEHVVFFPGPDAAPSFRRFPSLDEAVRFVEHMRNVEGVTDVSVHAMTVVPLAFRAYYKVEVPADGELPEPRHAEVPEQAAAPEPAMDVVPDLQPVTADGAPVEAAAVEPDPGSNGKRSLGFFAH